MSAAPQTSWRHHYLPQFYLRQWTTEPDGKVWCYKRERSGRVTEKRVAPKATAFEDRLYSVETAVSYLPERFPDSVETRFLSPLDNLAAPILQRLVTGDALPLAEDERTVWALFLNSLIERDPRLLRSREQQTPAIADELVESFVARGLDEESRERRREIIRGMDHRVMARNTLREHMVNSIRDKEVIDYFKRFSWRATTVHPALLTSDAPLIVNNGHSKEPIFTLSLALSPSRLFVATHPTWSVDDELLKLIAFSHNLLMIDGQRFLYSHTRIEDGSVVRLRFAVDNYFGVTKQPEEP